MYNVVTSFGNYPTHIDFGVPGPFTAEELGVMWLRHVAIFSEPHMLAKYRLILLLPRDVVLPETLNPYLDLWGDKRRFDENSKVTGWPLGPNLVFQQVLWFYHHKKMEGPFLWCEPDCIPVRPTWLDDLWGEYNSVGRPFMGGLVNVMNVNGQRIPKHMTGNAIYPDKPYLLAPAMLEARMTAWDVFAAPQIMQHAHFSDQIQHEYRGKQIESVEEMRETVKPKTALFHTDKFGAIIRLLASGAKAVNPLLNEPVEPEPAPSRSRSIAEAFCEREETPLESLDRHLEEIEQACRDNKEARSKVARYLIEAGIVNQGHLTQHNLRLKKQREAQVAATEPA